MAHLREAAGTAHNNRRSPNAHSSELQESKRREKMQAHSSSHRTSGTAQHAEPEKTPTH